MFETTLGTEKERDTHKIEGTRNKGKPGQRMEERLVCKKKRKEYLDNYQYLETKDIRESQPAPVIHERLGDIVGGVYEESSVERIRSGSSDRNRGGAGVNASSCYSSTLISGGGPAGPSSAVSATKTKTSVTKVGRRGGSGGAFGTTTTSTSERTTTRGGGVSSTATKSTSRVANY